MSTHNTTYTKDDAFSDGFCAGGILAIGSSIFLTTVLLKNVTLIGFTLGFFAFMAIWLMPFAIAIIIGNLACILASNNSKKNATVKNARNPKTFNDLINGNISAKLSDKGPVTKQQIQILKNMTAANMITEKDIQPLSSQTLSWLRENRTFFESSHTLKEEISGIVVNKTFDSNLIFGWIEEQWDNFKEQYTSGMSNGEYEDTISKEHVMTNEACVILNDTTLRFYHRKSLDDWYDRSNEIYQLNPHNPNQKFHKNDVLKLPSSALN